MRRIRLFCVYTFTGQEAVHPWQVVAVHLPVWFGLWDSSATAVNGVTPVAATAANPKALALRNERLLMFTSFYPLSRASIHC